MNTPIDPWLPLVEYSNKYQVSISTLRRRIRAHTIKFKLDDGKYFINDEPIEETIRPIVGDLSAQNQTAEPHVEILLEELKRAYARILQEKEEQICQLREEISDLRTLVRVLESENERLNKNKKGEIGSPSV